MCVCICMCVCVCLPLMLLQYGGVSSPCCRPHSLTAAMWMESVCLCEHVCVCVCVRMMVVSSPCNSPALIYYLLFKEPLESSEIDRELEICHKLRLNTHTHTHTHTHTRAHRLCVSSLYDSKLLPACEWRRSEFKGVNERVN